MNNNEHEYQDISGLIQTAVSMLAKIHMGRDGDDKETAIERAVDHIAFECDQYIDNPDFFNID